MRFGGRDVLGALQGRFISRHQRFLLRARPSFELALTREGGGPVVVHLGEHRQRMIACTISPGIGLVGLPCSTYCYRISSPGDSV